MLTIIILIIKEDPNSSLIELVKQIYAEEGTIRKKYGISIDKNSVHGSDSIENAKKEIDFFFKD